MEPRSSHEITKGAESPNPGGVRKETPGEEAKGGCLTATLKQMGADEDAAEEEVKADCENDGEANNQTEEGEETKHAEELDPRIQVCC